MSAAAAAQSDTTVSGTVFDSTGAPVPGASVRLESSSGVRLDEIRTATDGTFALSVPGGARVVVSAAGFALATEPVSSRATGLRVTLQPAPFFEEVNVTSTRSDAPRSDPNGTVTVLSSEVLLTSAPITIDDALKAVPGFTLFRRTSSRSANPTAQGVSLRGLGGTGASRSLVLSDGVPLNDAFGGWVYWDRVPHAAIDRVEVLRGSASDLYGADAVAGVVQVLTLRPTRATGRALLEGGNLDTGRVSLFAGGRSRGFSYSAAGQWFTTEGYIPVSETQSPGIAPRGPVDEPAGSMHRSVLATGSYQTQNGWRVEGRGTVFREERENGTALTPNDTSARNGSGEVSGGVGGGFLAVRFFGGNQDYDQNFSSVSDDRATERLIRIQSVPSSAQGVGAQWVRTWGRQSWLIGAEGRFIDGTTIETPFSAAGVRLATTRAGGRQRVGSAFVQGTFRATDRLTIVAGAHGDGWHTKADNTGFERTLGAFNPRASVAYRMGDSGVSLRASAYGGFRAPTLNELYRGFRVGNTVTNPNEALEPERLKGFEGGVLASRGRVSARVTGFWSTLDEAVSNVTVSSTPSLITRQRRNADEQRASGVEFEAELALPRAVTVGFAGAVIASHFKGQTDLRDKRVPQVAKYNLAFTARYQERGWTGSGQVRVTGPQFENDQNTLTLRRATVLDLHGGRDVVRGVRAFVAIENVFDEEYDVGRTPTLTIGLPRTVRAGVQVAFP